MKLILEACLLFFVITVISGILYPLTITGISQLFWSDKSHGSLVRKNEQVIGSALLAQEFKKPEYFWPRPSASNYNPLPSGASNLGPTSADLKKQIAARQSELSMASGLADVPTDLLTTSGSGLDPHISFAAASAQIGRVARARKLDDQGKSKLEKLVDDQLIKPLFGILGERRINVLLLNIELDKMVY